MASSATEAFSDLATNLTALQAQVAAYAAKVATAAAAVAALSANASGQETNRQRYDRLNQLFRETLGSLAAPASVLQGLVAEQLQPATGCGSTLADKLREAGRWA
jgi:hypothetical protein